MACSPHYFAARECEREKLMFNALTPETGGKRKEQTDKKENKKPLFLLIHFIY
jgi:hypothetical protein